MPRGRVVLIDSKCRQEGKVGEWDIPSFGKTEGKGDKTMATSDLTRRPSRRGLGFRGRRNQSRRRGDRGIPLLKRRGAYTQKQSMEEKVRTRCKEWERRTKKGKEGRRI